MKKIFLFLSIILFIILLGMAITVYINTYLPKNIKTKIEETAKNNFGQTIKIKNIKIDIFKGIILDDVSLYNEKEPFSYLKIKKIKVLPFYPSLLFKTKIINSCEFEDIKLFVVRYKDNSTNLPTFKQTTSSDQNLFLKKILLKNLNIEYIDHVVDFKKTFNNIKVDAKFSLPYHLYFNIDWQNLLKTKGLYEVKNKNLDAEIKIKNINLAEFNPYFGKIKLINSFVKEGSLKIKKKNTNYNLVGSILIEYLEAEFPIKNNDTDYYPIKYIGPLFIKNFNFLIDKNLISYNINADFKDATIKNIPKIQTLANTWGKLQIENEKLSISLLKTKLDDNDIVADITIEDFSNPKLYIKAKLDTKLQNLLITAQKVLEKSLPTEAEGDVKLLLFLDANILQKKFNWKIDYLLKDASFLDFNRVNSYGRIQNDTLFFEKTNLFYKEIPIKIKGKLQNLTSLIIKNTNTQPYLKIEGSLNCQLPKLIEAIKQIKNFSFDKKTDGILNLNFKISGNPNTKDFDYIINYDLSAAVVDNFTNIKLNGKILKDILKISNAEFSYKNIIFKGKGSLENFTSPQIKLSIESQFLNLYLNAFYLKNSLNIKELFITAPNSKVVVEGKISSEKFLELNGFGSVAVEDFINLLNALDIKLNILEKSKPTGIFDVSFLAKGKPNIDDLNLKASIYGQNLNLYNLNFSDTKINLYKEKENLMISPITTYLADGIIELKTKVNLNTNKAIVNLLVNDIDLSIIRRQLNLKNKKLSGKLSLEAYLENPDFRNFQNFNGEGKVAIKDGNIWEISFLKGFGEFLFIPDFDDIKFTDGKSDIILKDKNIIFENLNLKALQMDLEGGGKISFDGNIHFIVFPHFNPNLLSASEGLRKITTNILGKSGLLIEIEGTLQKPVYKKRFLLLSPKTLENVKNFFRNLLD